MTQEYREDLVILEIDFDENENPSIRFVNLKFKKLALIKHPDKPGGTKEEFQVLINAYRRVIKYLEETDSQKANYDEANDEAHYEKEFFMRSNFPRENKTGFTVILQNDLSDEWKEILKKNHGDGENLPSGGIMFKNGNITVTLYIKPKRDRKTKVHVQSGSQDANVGYVFNDLPLLFKQVLVLKDGKSPRIEQPKLLEGEMKKKATPRKATVKCDQCRFKSSMIQMKMHIKNMHTKRATRASKRLHDFTPATKPSKRTKSGSSSPLNHVKMID